MDSPPRLQRAALFAAFVAAASIVGCSSSGSSPPASPCVLGDPCVGDDACTGVYVLCGTIAGQTVSSCGCSPADSGGGTG